MNYRDVKIFIEDNNCELNTKEVDYVNSQLP